MKSSNLMNDMMNFHETSRIDLKCDNIAIHKESEPYPLSRKHNFENTIGRTKLIPSSLSRAHSK